MSKRGRIQPSPRLRAQRDRAMNALEQLVAYVKRVGGYMSPEDQMRLRQAEQVLQEPEA